MPNRKNYKGLVFLDCLTDKNKEVFNFVYLKCDKDKNIIDRGVFYLKKDIFSLPRRTANVIPMKLREKIEKGLSLEDFISQIEKVLEKDYLYFGEFKSGDLSTLFQYLMQAEKGATLFDGLDCIETLDLWQYENGDIIDESYEKFLKLELEEEYCSVYTEYQIVCDILLNNDLTNFVFKSNFSKELSELYNIENSKNEKYLIDVILEGNYVVCVIDEDEQLLKAKKYNKNGYKIDEFVGKLIDNKKVVSDFDDFCDKGKCCVICDDLVPHQTEQKLIDLSGEKTIDIKFIDLQKDLKLLLTFAPMVEGDIYDDDIEKINMQFINILFSIGKLNN